MMYVIVEYTPNFAPVPNCSARHIAVLMAWHSSGTVAFHCFSLKVTGDSSDKHTRELETLKLVGLAEIKRHDI